MRFSLFYLSFKYEFNNQLVIKLITLNFIISFIKKKKKKLRIKQNFNGGSKYKNFIGILIEFKLNKKLN